MKELLMKEVLCQKREKRVIFMITSCRIIKGDENMLLNKLGLCVKELGEYPDLCQLPNYREYDTMLKNKKKVTLLQKQKENTAILGL
jgi:hypothetical protein